MIYLRRPNCRPAPSVGNALRAIQGCKWIIQLERVDFAHLVASRTVYDRVEHVRRQQRPIQDFNSFGGALYRASYLHDA